MKREKANLRRGIYPDVKDHVVRSKPILIAGARIGGLEKAFDRAVEPRFKHDSSPPQGLIWKMGTAPVPRTAQAKSNTLDNDFNRYCSDGCADRASFERYLAIERRG